MNLGFILLEFVSFHLTLLQYTHTQICWKKYWRWQFLVKKNIPPLSSTPSPNLNYKMIKDHIILPLLIINQSNLEWGGLDW